MKHKSLESLDRQSIDCGSRGFLVEFKLDNSGCSANDGRYACTCVKSNSDRRQDMTVASGCSDFVGRNVEYLDRQNVACESGYATRSFKVVSCSTSGQMKYELV